MQLQVLQDQKDFELEEEMAAIMEEGGSTEEALEKVKTEAESWKKKFEETNEELDALAQEQAAFEEQKENEIEELQQEVAYLERCRLNGWPATAAQRKQAAGAQAVCRVRLAVARARRRAVARVAARDHRR